MPVKLRRCAN